MSIFVSDSFTEAGTGDSSLNAHTGEVGATWTQHPHANYSGGPMLLNADSDRVFCGGTAASYASGVPPSADYYVQAPFFHASTIATNIAVCARMDTTADTMYLVRLNGGTIWEMRRIVAGAAATLNSGAATTTNQLPTVGNAKLGKLVVEGDQISFYIEGVLEIGPVTDTNITAVGRAGVRNAGTASATTGMHLESVEAGTLDAPPAGGIVFRPSRLRPAIFKPGRAR